MAMFMARSKKPDQLNQMSVQDYARGIIDTAYKADQQAMNPQQDYAARMEAKGWKFENGAWKSPGTLKGEAANRELVAKHSTPTLSQYASQTPSQGNRIISLRPGAGVNPTQSTYGFSSMQPSNNAGMLYRIDQYGNKRYL